MKLIIIGLWVAAFVIPVSGVGFIDTTGARPASAQTTRMADSSANPVSASGQSQSSQQAKKITIIKKDIDYSTFAALAVGMMGFIALFYTSVQTWNPGP